MLPYGATAPRILREIERRTELGPLLDEASRMSRAYFGKTIYFYAPGMIHFDTSFFPATNRYRFPGISITGSECRLNCDHCRGKTLQTMIPATTPQKLLEVCRRIKEEDGEGCLISGGSLPNGSVPLTDFIPAIKHVKRELGLDVVVHTGIIHTGLVEALAEADVDGVLVDVIGSNETLREICHLNLTVEAFDRSLTLLEQYGIPVIPHIVVGIHYGKLRGEWNALEIISRHRSASVIIVALTPLDQTPMERVDPPPPLDVARVILAARLMMPKKPLILGCARPRGEHKSQTDILAIQAGVNGIAYPSEEAYHFARKMGLAIRFSVECCALIYRDLSRI